MEAEGMEERKILVRGELRPGVVLWEGIGEVGEGRGDIEHAKREHISLEEKRGVFWEVK